MKLALMYIHIHGKPAQIPTIFRLLMVSKWKFKFYEIIIKVHNSLFYMNAAAIYNTQVNNYRFI